VCKFTLGSSIEDVISTCDVMSSPLDVDIVLYVDMTLGVDVMLGVDMTLEEMSLGGCAESASWCRL